LDPIHKVNHAYNLIGSRSGRHGWENFAPLSMASLLANKSKIPSMFPLSTLAKFSLYVDMNESKPTTPQGTLWAEIWRHEAIDTSAYPSCETPTNLAEDLRKWDEQLRAGFKRLVSHPVAVL
jgi:hypothetical protein